MCNGSVLDWTNGSSTSTPLPAQLTALVSLNTLVLSGMYFVPQPGSLTTLQFMTNLTYVCVAVAKVTGISRKQCGALLVTSKAGHSGIHEWHRCR